MAQVRVKWYSAELGYGFILPDDRGTEILVRREDIATSGYRAPEKGARVTYEVAQGAEGAEARNVSEAA
jgi:cold shock protein